MHTSPKKRRVAPERRRVAPALPVLGLLHVARLATAPSAAAQPAPVPGAGAWNAPRAVEIARTAIEARRGGGSGAAPHAFRARAEGYVYFLGEFGGERQVVRADQVALSIRWEAPDRSLQTIVGRRHAVRLPTDIHYHIDHLSVVLGNFGDRIRLGEGQEVRDVLHPAAASALEHYQYRLEDSLEIRIHDRSVRVYRLSVRPARPRDPGVVGSMYVERASGAIPRLAFTFTAPSYVDPSLDYVHVDLRSALWEGRYWLPAEQEVEIRRQVSWLSFPVAGIIRTRFRIFDYVLNPEPDPPSLPPGARVAALPSDALARYGEWREPLEAGPARESERGTVGLSEIRARARELVGPRLLTGTSALQAHLPGASGALRGRRAEGFLLGGGVRYALADRTGVSLWLGYPFAGEDPELSVALERRRSRFEVRARAFANRLADAGTFPAAAGLVSTFAFLLDGEDYTDPFFEDGIELETLLGAPSNRWGIGVSWTDASNGSLAEAPLAAESRPLRPVQEGTLVEGRVTYRHAAGAPLGTRWRATAEVRAATDGIGDFGFSRFLVGFQIARARGSWGWSVEGHAGAALGRLPPQRLFLVGGRGTVPGYGFRTWGGDRAAWTNAEIHRRLVGPWVTGRAGVAAGWTDLSRVGEEAAGRFGVTESGGARPSASLGLGFVYDVLRLDLSRGIDGGDWVLFLSVRRSLWPIL